MRFGRVVCMLSGMNIVAMRHMRVMRGFLMIAGLVMLGGLFVVARRMLMMFGGLLVMIGCFL